MTTKTITISLTLVEQREILTALHGVVDDAEEGNVTAASIIDKIREARKR